MPSAAQGGVRRAALRALPWIVTVGLLALAAWQIRMEQLEAVASPLGLALLIPATGAVIVMVLLNGLRWRMICRILGLPLAAGAPLLRWTMIGHFFNQLLPSSVGGDAVRALLAGKVIGSYGSALMSVALDRLIGLAALLLLVAAGQPFLSQHVDIRITIAICVAAVAALALLPFAGRLHRRFGGLLPMRLRTVISRIGTDVRALAAQPRLTAAALGLSLLTHCLSLGLIAAVARALGSDISLIEILLIVPSILLIASLPVSVGGWGIRETALAVGFVMLGHSSSIAVTASIIVGLANLAAGLAGGAMWWSLPPADRSLVRRTDPPGRPGGDN